MVMFRSREREVLHLLPGRMFLRTEPRASLTSSLLESINRVNTCARQARARHQFLSSIMCKRFTMCLIS